MPIDFNDSSDHEIREAALAHCAALRAAWGDAVPARVLRKFVFHGQEINLYSQQGIFKPKEMSNTALSLRTSLGSHYSDEVHQDGDTILYDFAPKDFQNNWVKRAKEEMLPMVYLVQVTARPSPEYMVISPVFVTDWDDRARTFRVTYEPIAAAEDRTGEAIPITQRYGLRLYRARLHQAHFRREVLLAYRNRCSVCELRVRPLLDGAHIVADADGGEPVVQNGLSLCANHHRAFDRKILRVRADYTIEVDDAQVERTDVAGKVALLDHHGRKLSLPKDEKFWPDRERLAAQ